MSGKREIVFDTETTGFDAWGLDRVTEIGCVEVLDLLPTGRTFHTYIDPQRDVPEKVTQITGLTREFLTGKPLFADKAEEFVAFVGGADMVAHNAEFDMGFINAELKRAGFEIYPSNRFIDTLKIARAKFPGSPASLDALCRRFDVSLTSRDKHGALIDAELLAKVYLELSGGRARSFGFENNLQKTDTTLIPVAKPREKPLAPRGNEDERAAHLAFMKKIGGEAADSIWQKHWAKAKSRAERRA